jgi:cytochrome c biogenesis protein CcdA
VTWLAVGSAFWLGLLTAISPCPLATNIAAISFIGRQVGNRRAVLASGLLYTLGRALTYVLLGAVLAGGLLAVSDASQFLQKYMNEMLGPLLILLGMVLLGWIGGGLSLNLAGAGIQARAAKGGVLWAGLLGILFALSFCPVSAGLFFAGLIPLAFQQESRLLLPGLYGLGTALPVVFFAFLIVLSTEAVGRAFYRLTQIEKWVRLGAGALFILAGLYYCLTHIYGLPIPPK